MAAQAEQARLADEVEQARLADEAEQARLADEAEQARIAAEAAEPQPWVAQTPDSQPVSAADDKLQDDEHLAATLATVVVEEAVTPAAVVPEPAIPDEPDEVTALPDSIALDEIAQPSPVVAPPLPPEPQFVPLPPPPPTQLPFVPPPVQPPFVPQPPPAQLQFVQPPTAPWQITAPPPPGWIPPQAHPSNSRASRRGRQTKSPFAAVQAAQSTKPSVHACPRCDLALSGQARFCRRCGLPQG